MVEINFDCKEMVIRVSEYRRNDAKENDRSHIGKMDERIHKNVNVSQYQADYPC